MNNGLKSLSLFADNYVFKRFVLTNIIMMIAYAKSWVKLSSILFEMIYFIILFVLGDIFVFINYIFFVFALFCVLFLILPINHNGNY